MTSLRRRLRLWVATWLVFQVASLSALVPRDCCTAHRPAATNQEHSCHENVAATHCPRPAADGAPCPMHRGRPEGEADEKSGKCSMRGTCDGRMASLFRLLSNSGVLTDSFEMSPDFHASPAAVHARESLIGRLASPDPPPPRA